jgi:hypothetical protein
MPTKDGFTPNHPLPLFLSELAEEPEQPGIGKAWARAVVSLRILKMSIFVVTAAAIAILSVGNPVAFFANVTASLIDSSPFQLGAGQSMPTIQSTAGAEVSPPTARDAPTRDEMAAAFQAADQTKTEINEPPAEVVLKRFQAWAAEEDAQAQVVQPVQDAQAQAGSVRPVQDAQAEVVQDAPAQVRPMQKHRHVRRVQNARPKVRREENARIQARPAQDARAQDQSVPNAQAPSFLQSLGLRN